MSIGAVATMLQERRDTRQVWDPDITTGLSTHEYTIVIGKSINSQLRALLPWEQTSPSSLATPTIHYPPPPHGWGVGKGWGAAGS